MPFADSSVDIAIFHQVAQHVTKESMRIGLSEAKRVIRDGGFLIIGPQETKDFTGWRFFKKEKNSQGKLVFKEYSYYFFVPEDKFRFRPRKRVKQKKLLATKPALIIVGDLDQK